MRFKRKRTNLDIVRKLNARNMAELIDSAGEYYCEPYKAGKEGCTYPYAGCKECIVKWLETEA